jgi:hypothetical protein
MMKKLLIASLVAGSLGSITLPAAADVVVVREAPPALRAERVPEPRRGYTWINGHWEWRNNHHVWVRGTWVRNRHGYYYNQPTWVERDGRWEMQRGAWRRGDRDRDGVPNRMDRDRDGDGVPNRMDNHPNNPNRP